MSSMAKTPSHCRPPLFQMRHSDLADPQPLFSGRGQGRECGQVGDSDSSTGILLFRPPKPERLQIWKPPAQPGKGHGLRGRRLRHCGHWSRPPRQAAAQVRSGGEGHSGRPPAATDSALCSSPASTSRFRSQGRTQKAPGAADRLSGGIATRPLATHRPNSPDHRAAVPGGTSQYRNGRSGSSTTGPHPRCQISISVSATSERRPRGVTTSSKVRGPRQSSTSPLASWCSSRRTAAASSSVSGAGALGGTANTSTGRVMPLPTARPKPAGTTRCRRSTRPSTRGADERGDPRGTAPVCPARPAPPSGTRARTGPHRPPPL